MVKKELDQQEREFCCYLAKLTDEEKAELWEMILDKLKKQSKKEE